ncbi:MAG: efflux RND transporter permease subunit [Alphaproteobacteria bacterium]|nr:efflux RND transporter permease subunit [Alphaproteobacteria bacterium SS10]
MKTLFLDYPRLLVLAIGVLLAAGLGSILTVPRLEDPRLTNRVSTIVTPFPGADAERVEALVTEPIEDALRTHADIKTITSSSRAGVSAITVELKDNVYEPEPIWSELRDEIGAVAPTLPADAGAPELDDDRGYAYTLIAGLRWVGNEAPNYRVMKRFAEALQDRFRNVGGTDLVRVYGAPDERVEVVADAEALAAAGLSMGDVARALASADAKTSAGALDGGSSGLTVEVEGSFKATDRIGRIPLVADQDGGLRLADVATVTRALQDPPLNLTIIDGEPSVVVASRQLPTIRVDVWAADTRAVLEEFRTELPQGIELRTLFDQSVYTENRLDQLIGNLQIGLLIVFVVLLITMGWRSAIIVGAALPLTSLMALGSFQLLNLQIHQMSVTGIIVALGLMVDNAIVMTNGIRADVQDGLDRRDAVARNVRRFAVPLLASTVTTVLAFMPIVLMPGPAGEFVGPISMAVIASLLSSYVIAMTLVPALAGLMAPKTPPKPSYWREGLVVPAMSNAFAWSIDQSLKRPFVSIIAAFCLPVLGFVGASTLSEQFFPPADRDQFQIEVFTAESNSIRGTQALVQEIDTALATDDRIKERTWYIGNTAAAFYYNLLSNQDRNPSYAQAMITAQDAPAAADLILDLQDTLDASFPGAQILVRKLEQGPPFDAPLEVRIYGPDLKQLRELGNEIKQVMFSTPDVTHVRTTLDAGEPKVIVDADEDQVQLAGLNLTTVAGQLSDALDGRFGGSVLETTEQLPVIIRLSQDRRGNLDEVRGITLVPNGQGVDRAAQPTTDTIGVPLGALGEVSLVPALTGIPHRDGERLQEVKGYLYGNTLPAPALAAFQARLEASGFELPVGYRMEFGGESEKRGDAVGNLLSSVALLLVLMITTVVLSFNSFRLAGIIFLAGFQAMGLGLLSVTMGGYPLGFVVIVGLMGLVGLAINATIVILAAIQEDPIAKTGDVQAMRDVIMRDCSRHIISTTITTFGGFLPLILTAGGFWPPFAIAIAGGTLMATVVSFYFTPAAYRLIKARQYREEASREVSQPLRPSLAIAAE